MTILAWTVLGLIAGLLASVLMGSGGYGIIGDIVVGILGAVVGGWLAAQFLGLDVTGLNLTSVAIKESTVTVLAWIVLGLIAGFLASRLMGGVTPDEWPIV